MLDQSLSLKAETTAPPKLKTQMSFAGSEINQEESKVKTAKEARPIVVESMA